MLKPGFVILCAATFLLSGCAGLGHHLENTLWVNGTPNAPQITSPSLAAAAGEPTEKISLQRERTSLTGALTTKNMPVARHFSLLCHAASDRFSSAGDISLPLPPAPSPHFLLKQALFSGQTASLSGSSLRKNSYLSLPPVVIPNGNGTFSLIFPNGAVKTSPVR